MKVILVANTSWFLRNFEGSLIRELLDHGETVMTVSPEDVHGAWFRSLRVDHRRVPLDRKGVNPLTDMATLGRLARLYRRERPDAILHNTVKPVIFGTMAARIARVPRVVNMIPGLGYVFTGDSVRQRVLQQLVLRLYRIAFRYSHLVLFQNEDDRMFFFQRGALARARSAVVPGLGVDTTHFREAVENSNHQRTVFLMIGRVLGDKGVREFVEAARLVRATNMTVDCQLLGPFDPENPSAIDRKVVEGWQKEGLIEYIDAVDDVRPILARADVLVLPSYREGTPNAVLEAMAMGKPVIATNVPGCKDAVVHGTTGMLVPPRDAPALARAMLALAGDRALRVAMGRAGRHRAVENYDVRKVNAVLLAALQGIPSRGNVVE